MCPVHESIICPVVIGRKEEIAFLDRTFRGAEQGQGLTVLLAGEAGIGKSRLVSSAQERLADEGWTALQGNFFEHDRGVPFAGIADLIRRYFSRLPRDDAELFAAQAPELAMLAPGINAFHRAFIPLSDDGPNLDKKRLVEAFIGLISRLSQETPTAIVLEDLHWADDASLELILFLSRSVAIRPAVVLLTYRSDEVSASLAHLVASLERERLAAEVRLDRLTLSEVDAMMQAMLRRPDPIGAQILGEIYDLTDGNPFFVEEVSRSLTEHNADIWDKDAIGPAVIPHSVEEAVRRHTAGLDEESLHVLHLAAVAGRRFDFALLLQLSGLKDDRLIRAINELIAAQLVVELSTDAFSFRHALTREAIYASLLLREKRRLHERIGEALLETSAASLEEKYSDLAHHASQAADWPSAFTYSSLAGQRALLLFSPGAAVQHFNLALRAATQLGRTAPLALAGRGKAHEQLGNFENALADYEKVLSEMTMAGDRDGRWQALMDLGMLWAEKDYSRTGEYLEQASQLAQLIGDPARIGHSLNRVANWLVNMERPGEGVVRHREALAIFQALDDKRATAGTLDLLGMANCLAGDIVQACTNYREAIPILEELDDRQSLASSLATLVSCGANYLNDASVAGDDPRNLALSADSALRVSRETGQRSAESYAQWQWSVFMGMQGQYQLALEAARSGLAIAIETEHTQWEAGCRCALGALLLDLLDFEGARIELEAAASLARETNSGWWAGVSGQLLAQVFTETDQLVKTETLLVSLGRGEAPWTLQQRQAEAAWTELILARSEPAEALALLDRLIEGAPNLAAGVTIPRLWRLRAAALTTLNRHTEAAEELSKALSTCLEQSRPNLAWRLAADLAQVRRSQGDVVGASEAAQEAEHLIEEMAANIGEEPLAANFRLAALGRVRGHQRTRRGGGTKNSNTNGLTEREVEILRLIASGNSSREIGEALVLSVRTVERHIANIYLKSDTHGRAQVTAYALQKGLFNLPNP